MRTIVAILAAHVREAEIERTRAKPPNSWQAYDYSLQAADAHASLMSSFSIEDLHKVRPTYADWSFSKKPGPRCKKSGD